MNTTFLKNYTRGSIWSKQNLGERGKKTARHPVLLCMVIVLHVRI